MKKLKVLLSVGLLVAILPAIVSTVYANPKSPLVIREINITGNEFVVLQATENISNLGNYWLGYASDDTAGNLVPSAQLPPQNLKAGQAIILTSDGAETCDAIYAVKLPFGLSNTEGTLEVRKLSIINSTTATFTTTDSVHWRNPTTSNPISTNDDIDLDQESGTNPVWYHDPTDLSAGWKVGNFAGCSLTFPKSIAGGSAPAIINWPQADIYPPATIVSLSGSSAGGPTIPARDIGLKAPILNEILPNPAKPQIDADDEFIELYNPNSTSFDLSGFVLETGSTTSSRRHVYTFPKGIKLPPKTFKAFKSSQTNLNLSNSGGQAWLLDPFSKTISKSGAYGEAKDGLAWALANGKWYWTTLPTPSKANVVENPDGSSGSSKSKKATVKGKPVTALKGASTSAGSTDSDDSQGNINRTPVHPWILAVVAALALLYGAYEYRHDLSNRIYQLRKYLEARRDTRK